jgi:hypothetical protein
VSWVPKRKLRAYQPVPMAQAPKPKRKGMHMLRRSGE